MSYSAFGAFPAGPTPQVPAGGGAPGPFPNTSVSAVNVNARGSATAYNGNVEMAGYAGSGPIPWTVTKYNRGDIAMRLSPANPAAADSNTLNKGFTDYTSPAGAAAAENQSWRPNPRLGITIPTAGQNGPIDWNDGEGGFYPTVAISMASSGSGYSMVDGSFGTGQLDINLGKAGSSSEGNFPFSVTWFPYDAGWLGGNVGNPSPEGVSVWNGEGEHAAGLAAGLVKWVEFPAGTGSYGGLGELHLPGVNAVTNGMLFTTSSQGSSDVNIVGVAPTNDVASGASYWLVTIREDSASSPEELAVGQSQFEFVYVPFNSRNLVGGYINGATGNPLQSAGTFTVARTGTGVYEFAVAGKGGTNGTLLLQVADFEADTSVPMASRAFLSYQYNQTSGKFVIQSRKVTSDTVSDLVDANFYVMWVDFADPVRPPAGPQMRAIDAVAVNGPEVSAKEGNLAANSDEPEILVTTIDEINSQGYVDPITGSPAQQALVGYFHDARTLAQTRGPFFIMGNPGGQISRHDVQYNPVSKQYVVVGNARTFDGAVDLLMIARVNPNSVAGSNAPLANVMIYDGLTNGLSYDDVAVAVSTKNGNFIVVAEHKVAGEGEGTYGAMFSSAGVALTPVPTRLDTLQGAGDEDDPDVAYLPKKDVFLYTSNTDAFAAGQLTNRIVGKIILTTPANNRLQVNGVEQPLADTTGPSQGHPASIENPFDGEIITAFDTNGNDQPTGELSYYSAGAAPGYVFTKARSQVPYLSGSGGNPFRHQHPRLAVDPDSGVIFLGFQARSSTVGLPNGYVFRLLDREGQLLPSQLGEPYYLDDTAGLINTDANVHNVRYSPQSDSFVAVFTANDPQGGFRTTYLASVAVMDAASETPQVSISIARSGDNVILTWPKAAAGSVLESTTALGTSWTAAPGTPVEGPDSFSIQYPATNTMFFRLRQ